jgi:hypothetical protein
LQKRLSDLNTRFRKVLNLIQEADDKALSTPEKAPTLLHEIRDQTERLQGSRDGAIPAVGGGVPVVEYFSGRDEKDIESILMALLRELSPNSSIAPHNMASTLIRFLDARQKAYHIMASVLKDDIIECEPLDNLVSALVEYPTRILNKWRLEICRLCDFS